MWQWEIFELCFNSSLWLSGAITFDEWIGFWVNVVQHGYAPDELEDEVDMLLEGNSWVDFNDGRNTGTDSGQ